MLDFFNFYAKLNLLNIINNYFVIFFPLWSLRGGGELPERDPAERIFIMPKYEIALLFDAALSQIKVDSAIRELEKFLKINKGKILAKEQWPVRDLAYPIRQVEKGIYLFIHYELPEEKAPLFVKELNLTHDILRYLITIPPKEAKLKVTLGKTVEKVKESKVTKREKTIEKPKVAKTVRKVKRKLPEEKPISEIKSETEKEVKEKVSRPKTVEESKKTKAKEQKAKKMAEKDLDQAIDKILSDEDLL